MISLFSILHFFNQNISSIKQQNLHPLLCTYRMRATNYSILGRRKTGLVLINRYWCKIVIPYLWNRPFELPSYKNRLKLFRTAELDFSSRMVDALYTFKILKTLYLIILYFYEKFLPKESKMSCRRYIMN
jgi:hypothetical protein